MFNNSSCCFYPVPSPRTPEDDTLGKFPQPPRQVLEASSEGSDYQYGSRSMSSGESPATVVSQRPNTSLGEKNTARICE
jgi:hypothetical protein